MKNAVLLLSLFLCIFLSTRAQIAEPEFSEPQLVDSLSTSEEESFPVPYNGGKQMYFVRTELDHRGSTQQIWHSRLFNGRWKVPTKKEHNLNTNSNSAVIGVSADNQTIYLFYSEKTPRKAQRGLAYTTLEDGKFSRIKKLKIPGFKIEDGFYSFFISPSEKYLLISMAPHDTSINEDIFVSQKVNGKWQQIKSLGPQINTDGFEISPYLFSDDRTLYFSSNGHGGLGDADIFVSKRLDDTWQNWTTPMHLKAPINSPTFDAYFVIGTGNVVYFASNRMGENNSDIYQSKLIGLRSLVQNKLKLTKGEFILNGSAMAGIKLDIRDSLGNFIEQVITDAEGKFSYEFLSADTKHSIELSDGQDSTLFGGSIFLIDQYGDRKFTYNKLPNGTYSLNPIEFEDEQGLFTLFGEPQKNIKLEILDASGNVIDFVFTDSKGKFNYQTLKGDDSYLIRIAEDDQEFFENALLYVLDKDGNKYLRYKKLPNGNYTLKPIELDEELDLVHAVFNYKNLPYANQTLVIYDENNFPMDTLYTDSSGAFSFRKLPMDETYKIIPLGMEEGDFELMSMELKLEEKSLNIVKEDNKSFVIKEENIGQKQIKDIELENTVNPDSLLATDFYLFFDFNKYILSQEAISKMDKLLPHLLKNQSAGIVITGHTDSVGSEEINYKFSLGRAHAAKNYLIRKGVAGSRISPIGKGESKPLVNNNSKENRALNRRVEIEIK